MGNYLLPLLEVNPNEVLSFGESAAFGLKMLFIGMLIVFSVLALLWLSLEISGRLIQKLSGAEKSVEKKIEPVTVAAESATDETELIAVLTAAIAASESAPAARFRVVSFKRK